MLNQPRAGVAARPGNHTMPRHHEPGPGSPGNFMAENIFEPLPTSRPPRESDRAVLERWTSDQVFDKSLARTAAGKPFVFYEGPPTANGTPHWGGILTRG